MLISENWETTFFLWPLTLILKKIKEIDPVNRSENSKTLVRQSGQIFCDFAWLWTDWILRSLNSDERQCKESLEPKIEPTFLGLRISLFSSA